MADDQNPTQPPLLPPDGGGPHHGLALARRMALLNYRSPTELNDRFERSWQSGLSPMGGGGLFAVESYLGFHGNKFTRRFDANSYLVLTDAMNSHDIGRDRGGVAAALSRATARAVVIGIDSDRLFPVPGQEIIARVNDHQNTIASAVEEQTATTAEMNRNVGEAAIGATEIADNISSVAQAAESTTEGVVQAQQAADELASLSAELDRLVGQFTV